MKKILSLPVIIFLFAITLVSCNQQNREFILGEWTLLSKPVDGVVYKWIFTEDNVYVLATDANENEGFTGELDTCASGAYILKNGVLTLAVEENPCRGSIFAGDWDIQSLDENFMTLRNEDSGSVWYEFEKNAE